MFTWYEFSGIFQYNFNQLPVLYKIIYLFMYSEHYQISSSSISASQRHCHQTLKQLRFNIKYKWEGKASAFLTFLYNNFAVV